MSDNRQWWRYRIVESTIDAMPVGAFVLDHKRTLIATWSWVSNDLAPVGGAIGERIDRVCVPCKVLGWGCVHGHEGEHGVTAPRLPALDDAL